MFGSELSDAVDGEQKLEIDGLLRPEATIVVERGDSFGRRYVVWTAFAGYALDEIDNCRLRRAVVSRREWIGGVDEGSRQNEPGERERSESEHGPDPFH